MQKFSNVYSNLAEKISKILGFIIGFWFFILMLALFWQVIARFFINASSSWTEELASYSLVWIVMVGIAIGIHELTIPKVEIVTNYLPERVQLILEVVVHILCCLLFIVFMVAGLQMADRMLPQKVASLKISVTVFYLSIPFGGFFDLFFSIEHILKGILKLNNKNDPTGLYSGPAVSGEVTEP